MSAPAPMAETRVSATNGIEAIRSIRDSVYAEKIRESICADTLRDSGTTTFLFANICTFIALLFAIDGMDVRTAIVYGGIAIVGLLTLQIVLYYGLRSSISVARKIFIIEAVGVGRDSIIALSLILDLVAVEQTYPNSAIGWVAMAAFLTLPLSSRLFANMLIGRSVIFLVCALFVILTNDREFDDIALVTPLIMAYFISVTVGYWLFLRSTQQLHTRMEILAIQAVTASQNIALDEARQRAEQDADIRSKIYRYIGHDLRQPINAINYMLYDLQGAGLADDKREVVSEARACVRSANELIEDLLILSRHDVAEIEPDIVPMPLGETIETVVSEFQSTAKQVGSTLKGAPTSMMAHGDPLLCRRVLRNFVSNAIKHAPGSRILVGARRRGDFVALQVFDTGPGLAPGLAETAFDPFVRSRITDVAQVDGFGLGLSISRDLAKAMGGAVGVASALGRGSCFELRLPKVAGWRAGGSNADHPPTG